MQNEVNTVFDPKVPLPIDIREVFVDPDTFAIRAFNSVAEAHNSSMYRHVYQIKIILKDSIPTPYWYVGGISEINLVPMFAAPTAPIVYAAENGLHKSDTGNKFRLGGPLDADTTVWIEEYILKLVGNLLLTGVLYTPPQNLDTTAGVWDFSKGGTASITLSGNKTLSALKPKAGSFGTLIVKHVDATSTLTPFPGSKVIDEGNGVLDLTKEAGARDVVSFYYDGEFYYWTYGPKYT